MSESVHLYLICLLGALMMCILARSRSIIAMSKKRSQLTPSEMARIDNGLAREVILELAVFAPISATLLYLLSPLLVFSAVAATSASGTVDRSSATYALLGMVSYGFPFATIRQIVTWSVAQMISRFATISVSNEPASTDDERIAVDQETRT